MPAVTVKFPAPLPSRSTRPCVAAVMLPLLLLRFWTISVPLSLTVIVPELLFIDTNVRVAPPSTSMVPVLPSSVCAGRIDVERLDRPRRARAVHGRGVGTVGEAHLRVAVGKASGPVGREAPHTA